MKKIIFAIIITLCLSSYIGVQASEQQYVFSMSDKVIEYNQEGNLSVSVEKHGGFASFILEVKYDTDFLELVGSKKSTSTDFAYNDGIVVINDDMAGKVKIVFASQENVTQDISLVDLTFKAIGVPPNNGDTLTELDVLFLDDAEWNDEVLTDVTTTQDGVISIKDSSDLSKKNTVNFVSNDNSHGIVGSLTVNTNEAIFLPSNTFTNEGYKFAGWFAEVNGKKIFLPEGAEYTVTCDVDFSPMWVGIDMQIGAAVRTVSPTGLRFYTQIDTDCYNAIKAIDSNVKCGTLICPLDYLNGFDFTLKGLSDNNKTFLDIQNQAFAVENPLYKEFRGVISNIKEKNYSRPFAGRGYIKFTYTNGEEKTIYSDFSEVDNARAVSDVARKALEDPNANYSEQQKEILRKFITE